jgi:hypothetical protein
MDAEVWDDDAGDDALLDREWQIRHQRFQNVGMREGLDIGQAETSQAGFSSGFKAGLELGHRLSHLHGTLRVLRAFVTELQATPEQAEQARTCP